MFDPSILELDFVVPADGDTVDVAEPVMAALAELLRLVPGLNEAYEFPPDTLDRLPVAVIESPGYTRPARDDRDSQLGFNDWFQSYRVVFYTPLGKGRDTQIDARAGALIVEAFIDYLDHNPTLGGVCEDARVVNCEPPDDLDVSPSVAALAFECDVEVFSLVPNRRA